MQEILTAIQGYPGCKDAKEVGVAEVSDTAAASIWRVTVVDSGGVAIENHAAQNVQRDFGNNMICYRSKALAGMQYASALCRYPR